MRRVRWLLLVLVPLLLSGCEHAAGLENRAYALMLGADLTPAGGIRLTVCVPKVGASGGREDSAEDSPYLTFSAEGDDFAAALRNLEWAVPRKLSLSHILLLALSREAASGDRCPELVDRLMETRSLYAAARVVVCAGSAAEAVRDRVPVIEPRLSSDLSVALANDAARGCAANTTLADLYYATHSVYGDPMASWSGEAPRPTDGANAPLLIPEPGSLRQTHGQTPCLGSAVFRGGRMALWLDPRESLCANLVRGELKELALEAGGAPVALSVVRVRREVADTADGVALGASVELSCPDRLSPAQTARLETAVARAVIAAVQRCQAAGAEPFGFSELAARRCFSAAAWRESDWRAQYAAAAVRVWVAIRAES